MLELAFCYDCNSNSLKFVYRFINERQFASEWSKMHPVSILKLITAIECNHPVIYIIVFSW